MNAKGKGRKEGRKEEDKKEGKEEKGVYLGKERERAAKTQKNIRRKIMEKA